jgi:hypothetical protein
MQHLQELRVDTSKASAYYYNGDEKMVFFIDNIIPVNSVLTFTLQDMLEMMPKELYFFEEKCILEIYPFLDSWHVRYMPDEKSGLVPYSFHSYKIINAVYECLCWLAENNYIGGEK